jgi:hypothetical protein
MKQNALFRRNHKERHIETSVIKLLDFLLPGKSIIYFSYYPGTRVAEYLLVQARFQTKYVLNTFVKDNFKN